VSSFDELSPEEQDFAHKLRAGLRSQDAQLDELTTARLRAARRRAVDASTQRGAPRWLFASGGVAAAATIGALLLLQPMHQGSVPASGSHAAPLDALEVLTDEVDAEFYEDLDLYRWLEREHDGAA
jgi:hypothetical protein